LEKLTALKWVKKEREVQYYWTKETGWTKKKPLDEYWVIEKVEEND
jgi:hypothetical protein